MSTPFHRLAARARVRSARTAKRKQHVRFMKTAVAVRRNQSLRAALTAQARDGADATLDN